MPAADARRALIWRANEVATAQEYTLLHCGVYRVWLVRIFGGLRSKVNKTTALTGHYQANNRQITVKAAMSNGIKVEGEEIKYSAQA